MYLSAQKRDAGVDTRLWKECPVGHEEIDGCAGVGAAVGRVLPHCHMACMSYAGQGEPDGRTQRREISAGPSGGARDAAASDVNGSGQRQGGHDEQRDEKRGHGPAIHDRCPQRGQIKFRIKSARVEGGGRASVY